MRQVACDATKNPDGVDVSGAVRWLRVLAFTAGATVAFGEDAAGVRVYALAGYVAPAGRPWPGVRLTGTIVVELATDAAEPYPGGASAA